MRWILKKIDDLKYNYIAIRYLIAEEKNCKSNIGLLKKIWCLLHGFSSSKYEIYDFKKNNYKLYLSDFKRKKTARINGSYSLIIDDKSLFNKLFEADNVTATNYGRVKNGDIIIDNRECPFNDFINFIKTKDKLIIKRFKGGGGKEIYRLSYYNENTYLNDSIISYQELDTFIKTLSDHLIMEHLSQLDYSNDIYPETINSIRIITMIDPETNNPFIPIAVHKFGSEKTKPVDNVWNGGMTTIIDLETGRLGKSAYHMESNNKIEWRPVHPDTNQHIEGTIIPNWQQAKNKVLEIAKSETNLKYVGWDIVLTDNGLKIIEGNNYSDVNLLQIHKPLLKDERVVKFYKYHGII